MKVLLDTTFMLPIVGVSVKGIASEVLNKLWQLRRSGEVELFYTEFNLLEILWVLSKLNYELPIVERGLKSIEKNMVKTQPKYSSLLKALELRKKGFHDVIDLLLYLTGFSSLWSLPHFCSPASRSGFHRAWGRSGPPQRPHILSI